MEKKIIERESGSYVDWDLFEEPMFDEETGEELDAVYEYVRIDNLFIVPGDRGNGEGRKLLEEAVKAIKDQCSLDIKIVACPQEDSVDLSRLMEFYLSVSGIDEVVAGYK